MLKDVEDARVVGGRGLETDGEGLVLIVAGKVEQACAGGLVTQHIGVGVELLNRLAAADGKARDGRAGGEQVGGGCAGSGFDGGHTAPIKANVANEGAYTHTTAWRHRLPRQPIRLRGGGQSSVALDAELLWVYSPYVFLASEEAP